MSWNKQKDVNSEKPFVKGPGTENDIKIEINKQEIGKRRAKRDQHSKSSKKSKHKHEYIEFIYIRRGFLPPSISPYEGSKPRLRLSIRKFKVCKLCGRVQDIDYIFGRKLSDDGIDYTSVQLGDFLKWGDQTLPVYVENLGAISRFEEIYFTGTIVSNEVISTILELGDETSGKD